MICQILFLGNNLQKMSFFFFFLVGEGGVGGGRGEGRGRREIRKSSTALAKIAEKANIVYSIQ